MVLKSQFFCTNIHFETYTVYTYYVVCDVFNIVMLVTICVGCDVVEPIFSHQIKSFILVYYDLC